MGTSARSVVEHNMHDSNFQRLRLFEGSWFGEGRGQYPTIEPFRFEETTRFVVAPSYPMLHYEQVTLLLPSREPSHWESGFIRPLEDGTIEISSAQDSGRVEVLRGHLVGPGNVADELCLELESVVLDHDPRLVRTKRVFTLKGNTLSYVMQMATRTTPEPLLQHHLSANLTRSR
jgi:hypothetical protein